VIGHAGEKRCNRDAPIHMYTSLSGNYVEPGRKTRLSQYSKSKSPNYCGCLQFPDSRQASDASAPERDHAYFLSIAGVATTGSQSSMNHLYSVQMHDGVHISTSSRNLPTPYDSSNGCLYPRHPQSTDQAQFYPSRTWTRLPLLLTLLLHRYL
jgi:hypothetical protein